MTSIRLTLDYKQITASIHQPYQSTKLHIEHWEDKTVRNIKNLVQNTLRIPVCDQRLFYPERHVITDDSITLKSLYLRDGDRIFLEFVSVIDIPGMDLLIDDLLSFAAKIEQWKQDDMFNVKALRNPSEFPNYEIITRATEKLAFEYFIPWKNPVSVAQRHYFVQRGAFEQFLEVFKFAELQYICNYSPTLIEDQNCSLHDLDSLVDYYNNEQMVLHMHCLSLLWNFSETDVDRKLVLQNNGLKMVCDALQKDPSPHSPEDNLFWVINSINETAVGCLVQYAEYASTQDVIVNNKLAINKLVYMVECRLDRDTTFYSLYSCQIAANTLFLCACNSKTPVLLVKNDVHLKMIELTRNLLADDHDMALRYYCCLFLARVIACPHPEELQNDIIEQVNELLEMFMNEHTPAQVSSWEEKHNYVWVTMMPFLSLAFTGGLIVTECNLKISGPGTLLTQQMGLFCLDHMSRLNENILLLVKEKLLPFISCLRWYLRGTALESLDTIIQRLPSSDPPTLSVIAKSQIARMKGLEYATISLV